MTPIAALQQTDIFYQFTPAQLELVASICREKHYGPNELIFEENSASDELYIIVQGTVEIRIDPSLVSDHPQETTQTSTIAVLRRGQSFGEIALVDQGLRSASALSIEPGTHLLVIPREELQKLCDDDPVLGYRLMNNLAADLALKIRNTDLRIRERLLYGGRPNQG